jgi:hypothetical protein
MYQRSSTYVMSVTDGVRLVFGGSLRNFYEMCMVTENLLDKVFITKVVHHQTSPIVSMRPSQYTFRNPFIKGSLKTLQTKTGSCRPSVLRFPFFKDRSRETLDGLRRVGFRVNTGIDGTGFLLLVWSKASGYYFGAISTHCFSSCHRTHRNAKHRCWRESDDNRRED